MIVAGRVEQVGDERIAGGIVRAHSLAARGEVHAPVGSANEAEARLDQLYRRRRDAAAQQGGAAQAQRGGRNRSQSVAIRVGDAEIGQVEFESFAPARPDEDGVLELEAIGKIFALEGLLDVGGEESQRKRAARQPPRAEGEEDGKHAEQSAEHLESDAGRRSHFDQPEAAPPPRRCSPCFLCLFFAPIVVIQSARGVASAFPSR